MTSRIKYWDLLLDNSDLRETLILQIQRSDFYDPLSGKTRYRLLAASVGIKPSRIKTFLEFEYRSHISEGHKPSTYLSHSELKMLADSFGVGIRVGIRFDNAPVVEVGILSSCCRAEAHPYKNTRYWICGNCRNYCVITEESRKRLRTRKP